LPTLQGARSYSGWRAYCQSKLANILFTYALVPRLEGAGVMANALHPGFVATNFGRNNHGPIWFALRLLQLSAISPKQGAQTIMYLATSPEVASRTGAHFVKERAVPSSQVSHNQADAQRLWQLSAGMTGL
jgi:NAD(P)-dependent dehydrogenase (short-subunit alcohol dehydrogenase family)